MSTALQFGPKLGCKECETGLKGVHAHHIDVAYAAALLPLYYWTAEGLAHPVRCHLMLCAPYCCS